MGRVSRRYLRSGGGEAALLPKPWEAHGADNAKRKEAAAAAEAAAARAVASLDAETQKRLRILVHGGTASTDQGEKLARLLGRVGGGDGQHGVMRMFDALHGAARVTIVVYYTSP